MFFSFLYTSKKIATAALMFMAASAMTSFVTAADGKDTFLRDTSRSLQDEFIMFDGACRLGDGGSGTNGEDFNRFSGLSLAACRSRCTSDTQCLAFEYRRAGGSSDPSQCEIWYTYPERVAPNLRMFGCYKKPVIRLKVTNLSFQQPFSPFFVMIHDKTVGPIFTSGLPASPALAILAEDGNPQPLVDFYKSSPDVYYIGIQKQGAPYFGGEMVYIYIPVNEAAYVTIASMAINTNDCFVALNSVPFPTFGADIVFTGPGYDAGSEVNNEDCRSIPGPACPSSTGNVRSGNGEGFVHIHRGFHGIGPSGPNFLSAVGYDWRNPMMRVDVEYEFEF